MALSVSWGVCKIPKRRRKLVEHFFASSSTPRNCPKQTSVIWSDIIVWILWDGRFSYIEVQLSLGIFKMPIRCHGEQSNAKIDTNTIKT